MNHWIFQGNPDAFDIDTYLAENRTIVWSVRQRRLSEYMQPGDEVFLWRAAGKNKRLSGVIAMGHLVDTPKIMPDDPASKTLWIKSDPDKQGLRVRIAAERLCLGKKETIRSEWIKRDPTLKSLRILKLKNETNYKITPREASRLSMLCRHVGSNWSREDDVAALWAYKETYGKSISRLEDTPVALVAELIGRPVEGVYNKLMNFRSIDPRDERKGLGNVNELDWKIWAEFFDTPTKKLDENKIDSEFQHLWAGKSIGIEYKQKEEYTDFGEAPNDNPHELAEFAAKVRKGQPKFRNNLLEVYENKCALSGWGPPEVLEAAHIYAHAKSGINHSTNGLLVRSDIHSLLDAGLLVIDPETLKIAVSKKLIGTEYMELDGKVLRSRKDGKRPSKKFLELRFKKADI